ncbi:autophagy-related protein 16-1 [Lepisosteus oculatus]|uniref:autophagy-related protein 16-1 n=1 Tax=Lepisosteus oculatus TaxID=7918 RepID=UPI00073FC8B9|nr:PREDICTED: autophagy-related protein 16-1-like [Lepisosteus oculatus]
MERWKTHVRSELLKRDSLQRDPYERWFSSYSRLLERLDLRETLWEEAKQFSPDASGWVQSLEDPVRVQLELRESRLARQQQSETMSELTARLGLMEAELQYCHSQVSRYRTEAVSLSRLATTLQASLLECELQLEQQAEELAGLRQSRAELEAGLGQAEREREELLQRWLVEKREQAERVNLHNDAQERWLRLTNRLKKLLRHRTPRLSLLAASCTRDMELRVRALGGTEGETEGGDPVVP